MKLSIRYLNKIFILIRSYIFSFRTLIKGSGSKIIKLINIIKIIYLNNEMKTLFVAFALIALVQFSVAAPVEDSQAQQELVQGFPLEQAMAQLPEE